MFFSPLFILAAADSFHRVCEYATSDKWIFVRESEYFIGDAKAGGLRAIFDESH